MTGSNDERAEWSAWDRAEPARLTQYVQPDDVRRLLRAAADRSGVQPPSASGIEQRERAGELYAAIAAIGVRYVTAESLVAGRPGEQWVREPWEVLGPNRRGTCLDVAVTFAGGCVAAGLHPLVVIVDRVGSAASHALVAVWVRGDLGSTSYPVDDIGHREITSEHDDFVLVDVTVAASNPGAGFDDAVASAAQFCDREMWSWRAVVDVGTEWDDAMRYATSVEPTVLRPAFRALPANARLLESIRAEYRLVPYQRRVEHDEVLAWAGADDAAGEVRVALIHGVGGAGKTRLVAELSAELDDRGWVAGFLHRPAGSETPRLDWMSRQVSDLMIAVDYAEAHRADVLDALFRAVANRPGRRTLIVLIARAVSDWWTAPDGLRKRLESTGVGYREVERELPAHVDIALWEGRCSVGG